MFDVKKKFLKAIVSEENLQVAKAVHEFVDKEVIPRRKDLEGGWQRDEKLAAETRKRILKGMVDLGLQKLRLPTEMGGLGNTSSITGYIIDEELSRGDIYFWMGMDITAWAMYPAMVANRMDLIEELFKDKLLDDEPHLSCVAITEPEGGCNIVDPGMHGRTIKTIARLEGDEWVINGQKIWPCNSGDADIVYFTVCTVDPQKGDEGIVLIYVPAGTPGLSVGKPIQKMGLCWTDINTEIFYDDVRVPKRYCVAGPGGEAAKIFHDMCIARLYVAGQMVGAAQAALEIILNYTKERRIVKPVREHSLHASIIADMAIAIETARAYNLQTAWMADHPEIYGRWGSPSMAARISAAKIYACDQALWVINKAMELMGSYGIAYDYDLEKFYRDAKVMQLVEGGQQQTRLDVARGFYPIEW
ncbi:MAG: acyl-CoA dehydrogenase family protein [Candidatus Bathyarchaeia archaeon]